MTTTQPNDVYQPEMYVDNRFVVAYQNPHTGREHRTVVSKEQLPETIEFHRRHGHLVNYVPYMAIMDDSNL